jgi:uncharacterized protein (DUF1684 family)
MPRLLLCFTVLALLLFASPFSATNQTDWLSQLRSARDEHSIEVQGWLKLVGLHSLHAGENSFGSGVDSQARLPPSAPNQLMVLRLEADGRVILLPPAGARALPEGVSVNGRPPNASSGPVVIAPHSDVVAYHTLSFRTIRSGGGVAVRVWDENSDDLRHFNGLKWYAPDSRYRVQARFISYPTPKLISIVNGDGNVEPLPSPGYAEFVLNGRTLRLHSLSPSPDSKQLLFAFRDATAAHETYGAGRFLFTGQPEGGELVLDFNLAENPACAYNPYTVCPLPPPENRLPVPIPAGEKQYHD